MSHRKPIVAPPESYRVAELRKAGVPRNRMYAKDIRRFGHGLVLHPDSTLDTARYEDFCRAIGQTLGPEYFVSRRSAAILFGIPCPEPPGRRVEVGSFSPLRAPRRSQVLGHRVRSGVLEWSETAGLVLPSPADVWCQLAAVLSLRKLVVAGDHLLTGKLLVGSGGRRQPPLTTVEQLQRAVDRHRGSNGSPLRVRAVSLLRRPVDSPAESELRLVIIEAGFPEPVVNCPVPVDGRVLHADLGYPELKIAIEYEGAYHFGSPAQGRRDARRRERMYEAGWQVLRVMVEDLHDPREFLRRLAKAIREAVAKGVRR